MDRRAFLKTAAAAGVGIPLAAYLPACTSEDTPSTVTNTATTTITSPPITETVTTTVTSPPITKVSEISAAPAVVPRSATVVEAIDGTELMLQAIAAQGVEKIFFNGGTDNFHFMEAVAKFKALGRPTPDLV